MSAPLLKSFDRFDDAVRARDELVLAGLPPAAIQLRSMKDEAGPAQGNFAVGNGRIDDSSRPEPYAPSQVPYEPNLEDPVYRGTNLLIVVTADPAQRERAEAILARLGGVDAP